MQSKPLTVSSITFSAPLKYHDGCTINHNEAAALNALLHRDLAAKLKPEIEKARKASPTGEPDAEALTELQTKLTAFATNHDFSPKSANSFDPVQKEALKLVKPLVEKALIAKGFDPKGLNKVEFESYCVQALGKRPDIVEEARKRVNALRELMGDSTEI